MHRLDLQFPSQSLNCAAWLYIPAGAKPAPVIVMAHGLGGVRQARLDAFAERFCAAGYACLVFDYRHFGGSEGQPRQLLDIGKQLEDWQAAIAFVRGRAEVDGARVILWGTSFGGGHVLATAAGDVRIAAAIAQCPFTDGLASSLALNPLSSAKVMALAVRDRLAALRGAAPVMVGLAGAPGSAALMTAADALPGYGRLADITPEQVNQVAARFALQIIGYFPGRQTPKISCPVLFAVCDGDSVAPSGATLRHARRAPKGEIKIYQEGHFEIYFDAAFERVVGDQLEFIRRHVPLS